MIVIANMMLMFEDSTAKFIIHENNGDIILTHNFRFSDDKKKYIFDDILYQYTNDIVVDFLFLPKSHNLLSEMNYKLMEKESNNKVNKCGLQHIATAIEYSCNLGILEEYNY